MFVTLSLALSSCGVSGPYVWYRELPKNDWAGATNEYVIGIGDEIDVAVYGQEALGTKAKIRPDGRFALPLIGEVVAVGKHPPELAREIEARLAQYVQAPHVIVNVAESHPITISVLGQVGHVGALTLEPSAGLLQALALAGGTNEFADKSMIFVIRRTPEFRRIRFTFESLVENQDGAAMFPLRSGDVILVE